MKHIKIKKKRESSVYIRKYKHLPIFCEFKIHLWGFNVKINEKIIDIQNENNLKRLK